MNRANDITDKEKLYDPAKTWPDIIRGFEVGEVRKFKTVNPNDLLNARTAISRLKQNSSENYRTESHEGYFTITRTA